MSTTISGDLSASIIELLVRNAARLTGCYLILHAMSVGTVTPACCLTSKLQPHVQNHQRRRDELTERSSTERRLRGWAELYHLYAGIGPVGGLDLERDPTADLGAPQGLLFSFSNVTPLVGIMDPACSASLLGDLDLPVSAGPEPGRHCPAGVGLLGLGLTQIRRKKR